jgi:hypothetical protein
LRGLQGEPDGGSVSIAKIQTGLTTSQIVSRSSLRSFPANTLQIQKQGKRTHFKSTESQSLPLLRLLCLGEKESDGVGLCLLLIFSLYPHNTLASQHQFVAPAGQL